MAFKRGLILSLIMTLFLCGSVHSQDLHNRTERVYGNDTIIADEPLPDRVYRNHDNDIMVIVNFYMQEKGKKKIGLFHSMGNGSVVIPGIIISARHVLTMALEELETMKNQHREAGIVANYSYEIMGIIISEDPELFTFPLNLRAYEDTGSERDLMALEVPPEIMKRAFETSFVDQNHPTKILLTTVKFANAKRGDKVYIVGTIYNDFDILHYVFKAEVGAVLENMPANRRGLKRHYRLRGHAEPGFSGGPVLNEDGELTGVTIISTNGMNFIYEVSSSEDVKDFLKDNNIK